MAQVSLWQLGASPCYSHVNTVTLTKSQIILCKYKVKSNSYFIDTLIALKVLMKLLLLHNFKYIIILVSTVLLLDQRMPKDLQKENFVRYDL